MKILSALFGKLLAHRHAGKEVKDFLYSMEEMDESYSTAVQKVPRIGSTLSGSSRVGLKKGLRSIEYCSGESAIRPGHAR
jgi:hypothetical protein